MAVKRGRNDSAIACVEVRLDRLSSPPYHCVPTVLKVLISQCGPRKEGNDVDYSNGRRMRETLRMDLDLDNVIRRTFSFCADNPRLSAPVDREIGYHAPLTGIGVRLAELRKCRAVETLQPLDPGCCLSRTMDGKFDLR
jgi:hypothetical protein